MLKMYGVFQEVTMTFNGLKVIQNIIENVTSTIVNLIHHFWQRRESKSYAYLTAEEVIEFNVRVTNQRGLLRDKPGLESAIMRPQMVSFYEDADIVIQTAVLIEGIAMAHSFIDGNKRTALLAGVTFLDINGYELRDARNVIGKKIEDLIVTRDTNQFREWLRLHTQVV